MGGKKWERKNLIHNHLDLREDKMEGMLIHRLNLIQNHRRRQRRQKEDNSLK